MKPYFTKDNEEELEFLYKILKEKGNKIKEIKKDTLYGEVFNMGIIACEIFLFLALKSIISFNALIAAMAIIYIPFKSASLIIYGSRVGRYIRKQRLNKAIDEYQTKIVDLKNIIKNEKQISTINEPIINPIKQNDKEKVLVLKK